MRGLIPLASVFIALGASSAYGVSEYAANCARVIGVPVPNVNCSDPNGTVIPNSGGDQCDNPAHGMSDCHDGTRFIRFVDTFRREGKDERVITMMMCRKTSSDAAGSLNYSDIGVIQYNETKHASCWFSSTNSGQAPQQTVRAGGRDRLVYPSPTTEGTNGNPVFWGAQPRASCIECHQNEVWLRSPFAMSAPSEPSKGYHRSGGRGDYATGGGNTVPDTTKISRRGLPCSVGKPSWNLPGGDEAPRQVKINTAAYDAKVPVVNPNPDAPPPVRAPAEACTACHYFGSKSGGMGCGTFLSEFRSGVNPHRNAGATFFKKYWMPPEDEMGRQNPPITAAAQYAVTYARALDALGWCCSDANVSDGQYNAICREKFGSNDSQSFNNNSCAACPGCGASPAH